MDQAISFLHDSGILLHYEDSSLLSDLFFINPQWLCSMLAKLITVKETNPFQKQGQEISVFVCVCMVVCVHTCKFPAAYLCCMHLHVWSTADMCAL